MFPLSDGLCRHASSRHQPTRSWTCDNPGGMNTRQTLTISYVCLAALYIAGALYFSYLMFFSSGVRRQS